MAAAQAAENHGDEWGLTWYYDEVWTHSQNSLTAAETPSSKTSSYGTFLKWSQRPS